MENSIKIKKKIIKGKIKAIQLEYTESFSRLMQSIRKAPDSSALGFRIQAQKLAIVVELLIVNNKLIFIRNTIK